ncbi:MAG: hypothetical protein Q9Q40_08100 [Acidobacteriota bacterium]|nr:hypothetical protein [Acidobacteriota bacterium]MDQ7086673.1 hypothetical protein [Acidobacteriota bacterium]
MGCGCLLALIATASPRLVIVLLVLFSNWFGRAFDGLLIPLLGFFFLPYTLLWSSVVYNVYGHWGLWQVLLLVVALLLDFGHLGGVHASRRRSR